MTPIYLDYAATTPVDPRVAAVMAECLTAPAQQANAASATHAAGLAAAARVEAARAQVAALIGAQRREIIFTSGATESNNLALFGIARAAARAHAAQRTAPVVHGHIVSARTEHKSVLDPLRQLAKEGFDVTLLEPDEAGRVPPDAVSSALRPDTLLVSIMLANNEVGSVSDVAAIAQLCRVRGVLTHTDAAQAVGKIPADVRHLGVDFLSFTAHKIYGPKGIGALYVREAARPRIAPIHLGGGHERGLRPGTLATHQVVGFGAAAQIAREELGAESVRVARLRERLWQRMPHLPGVTRNGPAEATLPGILNVSLPNVEGESLLMLLSGLAVSSGSACSSATREPSYVLRAMGHDAELAQSSLRLSLGRATTEAETDAAGDQIRAAYGRLLALAGVAPGPDSARLEGEALPAPPPDSLIAHSLSAQARRYFLAPPRPRRFMAGTAPAHVRQGRAGQRSEGTEVVFELEIAGDFVKEARFSAYGCPHTLAVVSWLCEVVEGARLDAGIPGSPRDWAARFTVPDEKLGRLLIVEDALRAAYAA